MNVDPDLTQRLVALFPRLAALEAGSLERMLGAAKLRRAAAGTVLFSPQEPCTHLPFLLSGQVGVYRLGADGRSILLYSVMGGETCVVSSGALLGQHAFDATGVAETDIELLAVPFDMVDALTAEQPAFRRWLFQMLGERMADLMMLVEAVAFEKLDQRLARLLLEQGPRLPVTHQKLATELGVAREMVSRVLRGFAERGWIRQSREAIEIADVAALNALLDGAAR